LYRPKKEEKDDQFVEPIDLNQQKRNIVYFLKEGETVVKALKRLSKENEKDFNGLTEAADLCLAANFYNVYQETREQIEASINTPAHGS